MFSNSCRVSKQRLLLLILRMIMMLVMTLLSNVLEISFVAGISLVEMVCPGNAHIRIT